MGLCVSHPPAMPNHNYNPDSFDAVLSRIEAKLDRWVTEAREWRELHTTQITELRKTVEGHERFKYWLLGLAAAGGAIGSKLLSWITTGTKP